MTFAAACRCRHACVCWEFVKRFNVVARRIGSGHWWHGRRHDARWRGERLRRGHELDLDGDEPALRLDASRAELRQLLGFSFWELRRLLRF